jgi:hypothetical protein
MTKSTANPFLFWLFSFLLLGYIVVFCYVSLFSHPIADDFSYASMSTSKGVFATAYQEYFRWGGRYTSNILWLSNPIKHNLLAYQLSGIGIILSLFLGLYLFLKSILKPIQHSYVVLSALSLLILFLYNMPTTAEGLYWYTGAVSYTLGSALTLMFFALLIWYNQGKIFIHKWVHIFLLSALLFVYMGFNEVLSVIILLLLFVLFLESFKYNNPHKGVFTFLFLIGVAGVALLLLSPGSANRAGVFENNKDITQTLFMGALQTIRFLANWISVPLIIFSIGYVGLHRQLAERNILFLKSFYLNRWLSLTLLISVVFISVALPYYATGILGQHRTVNVGYLFFLLLWFVNLSVWINHYQWRVPFFTTLQKLVLLIVLMMSLTFTNNGYKLLTDIANNKLQQYDLQMRERYKIIKEHQQNPSIKLEFNPIEDAPATLFVLDIDADSTHWINESYRLYYKLEEHVKLKK